MMVIMKQILEDSVDAHAQRANNNNHNDDESTSKNNSSSDNASHSRDHRNNSLVFDSSIGPVIRKGAASSSSSVSSKVHTVVGFAAHGLTTATWIFLITFGCVREAHQLTAGVLQGLVCGSTNDSDDYRSGTCATTATTATITRSSYSDACCYEKRSLGDSSYNITYNVLNVVGGTLACGQLAWLSSWFAFHVVMAMSCSNFAFFMRFHLRAAVTVPLAAAGAFVYQHVAYHDMFCGDDPAGVFCVQPPRHYDLLRKVYESLLVLATVLTVLDATYVGLFMWTFLTRRMETWREIGRAEDTLLVTGDLREAFEARNLVHRTYDIRDFVHRWANRSDESLLNELPVKAAKVATVLNGVISGAFEDRPSNETAELTKLRFREYARRRGVVSDADADKVWSVLTCGGDYPCISAEGIEDLLYRLYFDRKQLANAIISDNQVFRLLLMYASYTLYPACGIVISKIFGYGDAFGRGIDLFKTYAVILTYIFSHIGGEARFMVLMLTNRPYNKGDVVRLADGEAYEVLHFNASHTFLTSGAYNTIRNDLLLDASTLNLSTKHGMQDWFDITVPLNSAYAERHMREALQRHMRAHPRDVRPGSERYGWVRVAPDGKTLRCIWRYGFRVVDRTRLQKTRTRIANALVQDCSREAARSTLVLQLASGGGLNDCAGVTNPALDHAIAVAFDQRQ